MSVKTYANSVQVFLMIVSLLANVFISPKLGGS
jgi:hypothetical protein